MKAKSKSIIISLFIVITVLVFLTLSIVSIAIPNLSKEIKDDLTQGVQNLCVGDIKSYYNMYNTRKLTEIEKTKLYEKISEAQDIVNSEMGLFKKYKLSIKINDVSIIDKIGENLFLCNVNVNYKYRKNHETTNTVDKTEDFIIKIIDVGNMDYKILLPFNSLDKDFSSSNIYLKLKEANAQKQAEKIQKERELEELKEQAKENEQNKEENSDTNIEHNAHIIENLSDVDESTLKEDDASQNSSNNNSSDNSSTKEESISQNEENTNSNNGTNNESDKSSYESFLED